jgi:hypothetical protein
MNLLLTSIANASETDFDNAVTKWSHTAKHPQTNKLFVSMIYRSMIELVDFLNEIN